MYLRLGRIAVSVKSYQKSRKGNAAGLIKSVTIKISSDCTLGWLRVQKLAFCARCVKPVLTRVEMRHVSFSSRFVCRKLVLARYRVEEINLRRIYASSFCKRVRRGGRIAALFNRTESAHCILLIPTGIS